MFKLQRQNNVYILTDRLTKHEVIGPDFYNLLFIADMVKHMRESIAQGKKEDGYETTFNGSPRALGKNMHIARQIVQKGLGSGKITNMAAVVDMEEDADVCPTCGGTGELDEPAVQRGGEIHGPDSRPCPDCQYKEPDDFTGASDGDR